MRCLRVADLTCERLCGRLHPGSLSAEDEKINAGFFRPVRPHEGSDELQFIEDRSREDPNSSKSVVYQITVVWFVNWDHWCEVSGLTGTSRVR